MPKDTTTADTIRHTHSLIVADDENHDNSRSKEAIYTQVGNYLANGHAVIYTAEPNPSNVIQQMSKVVVGNGNGTDSNGVKDIEYYISNNMLIVKDRDEFYSPDRTKGFDAQKLMDSWHSLILQAKRKSKSKGIIAVGTASAFLQTEDHNNNAHNKKKGKIKLLKFEDRIGKKFAKPVEFICWYDNSKLNTKLSFCDLVSIILKYHHATIHEGWNYRKWYADDIAEIMQYNMDRVLGQGTFHLLSKTLKLVYHIDIDKITVSKPELFEEKTGKILGEGSADLAFNAISNAIRREASFTRAVDNSLAHTPF